jgi:hypothetical protein
VVPAADDCQRGDGRQPPLRAHLELRDLKTIEPEAEADSPDEVYASEGTFSANDCVRGALVFAVPIGATPEHLLLVGNKGGMRWRLT